MIVFSAVLVACSGPSSEGGGSGSRLPVIEKKTLDADSQQVGETERALETVGIRFRHEISYETGREQHIVRFDEAFARKHSERIGPMGTTDERPALEAYLAAAESYIEKYDREFILRQLNGTIQTDFKLSREGLGEMRFKISWAKNRLASLVPATPTPVEEPAVVTGP